RFVESDTIHQVFAQFSSNAQMKPVGNLEVPFRTPTPAPGFLVLAELVAMDRVFEEIGEVGKQVPVIMLDPAGELPVLVAVVDRQDLALGLAAQCFVDSAEAVRANRRADDAQRQLFRRSPAGIVDIQRYPEVARSERSGIFQEGRIALQVFGQFPRAVVKLGLAHGQKVAGADLYGSARYETIVI